MRSFLLIAFAVLALACTNTTSFLLIEDGDSETDTDRIETDRDSERDADTQDQAEAEPERDAAETDAEPEPEPDSEQADTDTEGVCEDGDHEPPETYAYACEYKIDENVVLNRGAAPCRSGTVCLGVYLDGNDPQQPDVLSCNCNPDCWSQLGGLGVCVGGYCGMSFCGLEAPCNHDADCGVVGEGACCRKQGVAGTVQCMPYDWCPVDGDNPPGSPCAFTDDLNKMGGACQDSTMCLGMLYNKTGAEATCQTKEDCAKYGLTSELVGCSKSGYCGISFCSADAGEACTAVGGTAPKPGQSAICEALPDMNSERYGKACCQVVSGKKLCIPDSLCTQEGAATAGQACKDPSFEVNATRDFCGYDLFCASHIFENQSCTNKSECVGIDAEQADCVGGHCALSFCTRPSCRTDADCPAEFYGAGACCTRSLYASGAALCAPAILCGP